MHGAQAAGDRGQGLVTVAQGDGEEQVLDGGNAPDLGGGAPERGTGVNDRGVVLGALRADKEPPPAGACRPQLLAGHAPGVGLDAVAEPLVGVGEANGVGGGGGSVLGVQQVGLVQEATVAAHGVA